MPGLAVNGAVRKRKRDDVPPTKRKAPKATTGESTQNKILQLEEQILQGREHYNNIVELQTLVAKYETKPRAATLAAVSLCRVFCRLTAGESLVKSNSASDADTQIVSWLKARLRDYVDGLTAWLGGEQGSTALTLLMRVVKAEVSQTSKRGEQAFKTESGTFYKVVKALLENQDVEGARQEFVEAFVEEHDDVRFYTFAAVKQVLKNATDGHAETTGSAVDLLSRIEGVPESEDQLEDWYGESPSAASNKQLLSLNAHRKAAQEAWLAVFRSPLTKDHRKRILTIATTQILPWFTTRLELLADFLTDSFDSGGSTSLLALSSIFHLMTHQNLEYPEFYTKLYSLLDHEVLHSKHRSRFFRLLDTFLNSSHLPAAMVASFIKRLSRLNLQAPPGAIVWVIPWVYNMLKQHPACTFMLHRPYHPGHRIYASENELEDPFDMACLDPNTSGAIDSSLWELEMLQSHYHPNVATLAKILSEQFTKREYVLEDFLDHSYATLIGQDLGKELKSTRPPEVEYVIPKRILTAEVEEGGDGKGLSRVGRLLEGALGAL
ncbi:Maturation and nuclear export of 40S ribosomal subunits interacting protein [Elasticomyces elasticus]|nr:Maturation and nuclear export of 40S ribosomal subunits interacting protein [Elasticomyces elasticus]KAK3662873.1 Maturation and nuclear export of 40S ribosomal subunits interacting protein [Elasticomyces elasticus]KAK4930068.1 Maturation and nuclear export of 40S ribosomal subunits interacting protein [Elasticomyces elasticus]KAK5763550.1 Maturation and nuclear export of 40S ribosomal subunits interacting protein [Elasticomyces elasticus]